MMPSIVDVVGIDRAPCTAQCVVFVLFRVME